ncbi:SRPBCC domain-containing protein [Nonomuraea angiospora]|uniref:Uncharacterized protein YndB with AHSA1/START domain n=1 Tax=Nonomuraea angiospora TaxID=46172 RepID=A0ABR9LV28_9ACTN|nr:SRPBCC domain-containing protein [Nonomuraea angiospora]MBE1584511.1 uncharacterized protein YndB with AHSA1/START domain [Nonomuraea angiospora]
MNAVTNPITAETTLSRVYSAAPEEVFAAWTEPARLSRWFGPHGFTTPEATVSLDVRPGGQWSALLVSPEGNEAPLSGSYWEVDRPARLVLTTGDPNNTDGLPASVVTVTLTAVDEVTRLEFHQAGVNTDQAHADGAKAGWEQFLDRLGHLFGPAGAARDDS